MSERPASDVLRDVAAEFRQDAMKSIERNGQFKRWCESRARGMNAQERRLVRRRGHAAAAVLSVAAQLEARADALDLAVSA